MLSISDRYKPILNLKHFTLSKGQCYTRDIGYSYKGLEHTVLTAIIMFEKTTIFLIIELNGGQPFASDTFLVYFVFDLLACIILIVCV